MKFSLLFTFFTCLISCFQLGASDIEGNATTPASLVVGDTLFFENWESGEIRSMWRDSSSTSSGLISISGGNAVYQGANGVRLGNQNNNIFTTNSLTLSLPIADYVGKDLSLEYWIRNNSDEWNSGDGIFLSDDGVNFVKVFEWRPDLWVDQYGKLPPLDLDKLATAHGLSFTDDFKIRFQQADDDNFNSDGIYLDNILIQEESISYATLPFIEGFEGSRLSPAWKHVIPLGKTSSSQTTPGNLVEILGGSDYARTGSSALGMGRRQDWNTFSISAADLHLNLQGYTNVNFAFWAKTFFEELTDDDAVYISDDNGLTFSKIFQFKNEDFQNLTYREVNIDLDSALLVNGLALTDKVVIRFQQGGFDDFFGNFPNGEDGITIDDISITGTIDQNAPVITSFSPQQGTSGTNVMITGQNFSANTQIAFSGVSASSVTFISSTSLRAVVPTLAQTGKISARENELQTASNNNFTILGRQVIFFEDWETGTIRSMWEATSSTTNGSIRIANQEAVYQGANGVRLGNQNNNIFTTNSLTLSLPIADYVGKDLSLEYWIRNNSDEWNSGDGIFLSDDGVNFVKVFEWRPDLWVDQYGKLPPLDLDKLATAHGLSFTDDFKIRFQQADDDNFNSDGIYLDNILIQEESISYATLPFIEGFEGSRLSPAWKHVIPLGKTSSSQTTPGNLVEILGGSDYARTGSSALGMGRRQDWNTFSISAADLHLNLQGYTNVNFAFWAKTFFEELTDDDAVYISDDNGLTFSKIFQFKNEDFQNLTYREVNIDLDSALLVNGLALTDKVVIRFQQGGFDDFFGNFPSGEDGITIDDISITGTIDQNAPVITSFSPQQGTSGTNVMITGQNFSANTQIAFSGVSASSVTFISSTSLRAVVPTLAQTGKISARENELQTASNNNFTILGRQVIFFEDWETGTIRSMWEATSSTTNGSIRIANQEAVYQGANGVRLGNQNNNIFTTNSLTLSLPIADYVGKDLSLEYWIRNNSDEWNSGDGIFLSDDGVNFVKVFEWRPDLWVDQYGKLPPLDLDKLATAHGLSFTDDFKIRFQQADDDNFNSDGIYLDNILIQEESISYATLPFIEGFEGSRLSPAWKHVIPLGKTSSSQTTPGNLVEILGGSDYARTGSSALGMGRRQDWNTFSISAADLHLNLQGYTNVNFAFWAKTFFEELTDDDAVYISDDNGLTFSKIFQFKNEDFQNLTYREVNIDLDSALLVNGLALTDKVVIRFQQGGFDDFFGNFPSGEDGITIDDISITGTIDQNAPVITSFSPQQGTSGTNVMITGQNFSANTQIAFSGVSASSVTFISSTSLRAVVPTLAQTGKISARENELQTASNNNFTILGRQVIFFEDWETGTIRSMWEATSSTTNGSIRIANQEAVYQGANGVRLGNQNNNIFTTNSLTLSLPIADYVGKDLSLEYWIRNNSDEWNSGDGIFLSDDGVNFVKVFEWRPDLWVDQYGKLPPLDLDKLATAHGLSFTDDFKIRFQQADDDNFNSDGIYLDNILIQEESISYATLPFIEGFEGSRLSPAWKHVIPLGKTSSSQTTPGNLVEILGGSDYARTGSSALGMGRRQDWNTFSISAADLHLNLQGYTNVNFAFWAKTFFEELTDDDAVYISDDNGLTFSKIFQFKNEDFQNLTYREVNIDLDSALLVNGLALTDKVVIRFQQGGFDDFFGNFPSGEDGITIDDISITGTQNPNYPTISFLDPDSGPSGTSVNIRGQNLQNTNGVSFNGVQATNVSNITATSVTAIVPEGATTGAVTLTAPIGPATSPGVFRVTEGNDLALIEISSPTSGCSLSVSEEVRVRIRNTGALVSNVPITLTLRPSNAAAITEVINPTLDPLDEITHTFSTTVSLVTDGTYTLSISLSAIGDEVAENNELVTSVTNYVAPEAIITGPESICNGDNAQLTASGGGDYLWSTGSRSDMITISPSSNATYTVTVTSDEGCTAVATYSLAVISPERPVITASNNGVICPGESITLTSSVTENVRWNNGIFAPSIEVNTPGIYRVTHTQGGCEAVSVSVQVTQAPNRRIIVSGSDELCLGESTILIASGGDSFSWSNGSSEDRITISPTATTEYQVTITENGCTFIDQQVIMVTPIVQPGEITSLLPADNSTNISNRPTLSWAPTENADRYDLYLWAEGEPEPTDPITVSGISYRAGPLSIDLKYNWYVIPKNDCQTGTPSATQCFTTASLPDLVVSTASGPLTAVSGSEILVRWSVSNNGQLTTGNQTWKDAPYLSRDQTPSADDIFLGAVERASSLLPGNAYNSSQRFVIPTCLEGEYYVIVAADYTRRIPEINNDNNTATSQIAIPITLSPKPDLVVDTIRPIGIAGLVGEGESQDITYTISNNGNGDVNRPFFERIFLNRDSFDNPNTRIPLGFQLNETLLSAGASVENTVSVTLPQGITGDVYFYVLTDFSDAVEECLFEENNRRRFGPVRIVADPRPDFVADTIMAINTASSGERIDVDYTFINEGIDFSGNVTVSAYLSDSPTFDGFDRIRTFSINADFLNDVTISGTTQIQLPNNTSGAKYLSLRINPTNNIDEGSRFNEGNVASRAITINAPDLTVSAPEPGVSTVVAGNSVIVSWTVTNNGPGRLINRVVRDVVQLRGTNVFRSLSQSLTLDVGASTTRNLTLNLPTTTSPGDYAIDLRTNTNFSVFENGITANNTATSITPLTVTEPAKPDLNALSIAGPSGSFLRGATVPISYSAENTGAVALSDNWRDYVYLSLSSTPGTGIRLLPATRNQARELDTGAAYTEAFNVSLPINISAGTYYLHLRLDAESDIFEESDANNGAVSGPFTVTILPPATTVDLELFDVVSDTIRPGRTISLSYKTRNIGNTATVAGSWEDVLVLSANAIYEPGEDRVIARWPHATNLSPNQTYAQLETFRLPDTLPEGNFRLILVTDGGLVTQDNERANNQRILSINNDGGSVVIAPTPRPDLTLTINEVLDPAIAGQPLRIDYTVSNVSSDTAASGSWYDGARLGNNESYTGPELGRSRQERSLATGASYRDTINGQIPISAEGNYFLTLQTDAGLDVVETSGANNNASVFLPVVRPLPGDLVVQQIFAPAAAQTNDTITVNWTLLNIGANPVDGFLEHTIYFSTDEQWDINDVELGRWRGNISLDTGSSTEQQTDLCLTDLANGEYYLIVRADALDNIVESDNENNETTSLVPITISVPQLFVAQEEATVLNYRKPLFYRLEVDAALAGQTVRISLDSDTESAVNELYTRFGDVPNRTVFDESYGEAFAEDHAIILSDIREGTYYIMAYAAVGPVEQPVTLLAEIVPFAITAINTNVGGNTGPVTTVLTGTRFAPGLQVVLEDASGARIPAAEVTVQSPERAFVTFDLLNAPFGTFDVIATSSITMDTDTIPGGFRITTGSSPTAGPTLSCSSGSGSAPLLVDNLGGDAGAEAVLQLEKIHPAFARRNQVISMTFKYVNEGNIDVVLPRLLITSLGGAPLGLDPMIFNPETLELGMEFQEEDGPPNILRPGGIATYSVYTKATAELLFRLY